MQPPLPLPPSPLEKKRLLPLPCPVRISSPQRRTAPSGILRPPEVVRGAAGTREETNLEAPGARSRGVGAAAGVTAPWGCPRGSRVGEAGPPRPLAAPGAP